MRRGVESREGRPQRNPKAAGSDGWGVGVGARESRVHQEEDGRRRPRACEKRETKVPSERVSCTQGDTCGTGEMGPDASWTRHGEQSKVLSRMPSKGQVRF